VLSIPHQPLHAAFLLVWLCVVATPAAAVMPSPAGTIPPEVAQAFEARLFELPDISTRLGTSTAQTIWNIPVILVGFSDQPIGTTIYGGRTPAQHFERALFDATGATSTGSVFDYYRWVSGDRIEVRGTVVATLSLAQAKDYYANNNWGLSNSAPRNMYGFVSNALQYADTSVNWQPFDRDNDGFVDMLWVIHSGVRARRRWPGTTCGRSHRGSRPGPAGGPSRPARPGPGPPAFA
jgi:hypothetical protein